MKALIQSVVLLVLVPACAQAAQFHSSGLGPFGFKFSLRTDDGSPLETVEDEDGSTRVKAVIGKQYRLVGVVPAKLSKNRPFTHLVLESQVDGSEDAWIASRKIPLNGGRRFDHTFKFPSTIGRRVWRMRAFKDDGLEGVDAAPPIVVSGLLSVETDYVFTVNLINDTKSDLVIYYPVQQRSDEILINSISGTATKDNGQVRTIHDTIKEVLINTIPGSSAVKD